MIAAFPFVFFFDEAMDLSFSPVLPALVVLVVVMVLAPLALVELYARRIKDLARARAGVLRGVQTSWACVGLAVAWLLIWFSWGL